MKATIWECDRRRKIQIAFNEKHNITPQTIKKAIKKGIEELADEAEELVLEVAGQNREEYTLSNIISDLEGQMEAAARNLEFEKAAKIRDKIKEIEGSGKSVKHEPKATKRGSKRYRKPLRKVK